VKRWLGPLGLVLIGFPIALLALIEFEIRRSGLGDRPLYRADAEIGYIPLPRQRGRFANQHDWAFNERSMHTAQRFDTSGDDRDILLIGDSLVFGGHFIESTLGPALARASGARVWPIAAPSWGLANELTYLEDNPDVAAGVDHIVFVLNSEDFGPASHWVNNYMHPTRQPRSFALYWLGAKFRSGGDSGAIPVIDRGPLEKRMVQLSGKTKARLHVFFYPSRGELAANKNCFDMPEFMRSYRGYCLGEDPEWSQSFYLDEIHPRFEAGPLLGRALARGLTATSSAAQR
jgi:hypothetical protein